MVVSKKFLHFSKHHFPKDSESGHKSSKISILSFLPYLNHPTGARVTCPPWLRVSCLMINVCGTWQCKGKCKLIQEQQQKYEVVRIHQLLEYNSIQQNYKYNSRSIIMENKHGERTVVDGWRKLWNVFASTN